MPFVVEKLQPGPKTSGSMLQTDKGNAGVAETLPDVLDQVPAHWIGFRSRQGKQHTLSNQ